MHAASAVTKRRMRILPPAASVPWFVTLWSRLLLTRDFSGYWTIAERRRHEQRMNTGTACDDDAHVLRAVGDANVLGIADLREPARSTVLKTLDRALAKARQRNAGALEHGLLDVCLADTVAVEGPGVLRAQYEQRPGWEDDVVVAETHHGAHQVGQNLLSGVAAISKDVLRGRGTDHGDGTVGGGEAGIDVERRPGAISLRFRNAEGKFAGLAVGRHVGLAGEIAADIAQHELHSSADGRIRAPPRPKQVAP